MTAPQQELPQAQHRRSWWPGWIWSVPIAALAIVLWLALRAFTQSGPEVHVLFPAIANLRAGDTDVTFQDLKVGQVEDVKLEPDLRHLEATISLRADMAGHLGPGTKFWIIGANPSLSDPASIQALISGVKVGIYPAPGRKQQRYTGSADPPALPFAAQGTSFVLHVAKLGRVQRGTKLYRLDQQVGKVVSTRLAAKGGFDIDIFVDRPNDRFVRADTRFWNAGPVQLSQTGGGTSIQFQSIPALFEGAIAFDTPGGDRSSRAAAPGQVFPLYDGQDEAESAPGPDSVRYRAVFHQASGVPKPGGAVTLLGERVGSVTQASLQYDPAAGRMQVATVFAVDPRRIPRTTGSWTAPRPQIDDMLRRLIEAGLHAELTASPPVVGGQQIALDVTPGPPGTLGNGPVPEVPVREGGGGISGVMTGVNQMLAKVDAMPLTRIGDNLQEISGHIARLTQSPALIDTIRHLDRTSASLQRIAAEAKTDLPPALAELRQTVAEAQQSLSAAHDMLSAQGSAASAPGAAGLPEALGEITRAARSLRELADYLDRHPGSLLLGRSSTP